MTSEQITSDQALAEPNPGISDIADLIEAAATRALDAPALVVTPDRVPITYRDLTRLVDDLAAQLTRGRPAAG